MQRFVSQVGDEDARSRYREEEADNNATQRNHGSISSGNDDRIIIAFEPNDRENPYNWSKASLLSSIINICGLTSRVGEEGFHSLHEHGDCGQFDHGQCAPQQCYSIFHQGMGGHITNTKDPAYCYLSRRYVLQMSYVIRGGYLNVDLTELLSTGYIFGK